MLWPPDERRWVQRRPGPFGWPELHDHLGPLRINHFLWEDAKRLDYEGWLEGFRFEDCRGPFPSLVVLMVVWQTSEGGGQDALELWAQLSGCSAEAIEGRMEPYWLPPPPSDEGRR